MRLLIAEDDRLTADTLAKRLREEAYAVDVCYSGTDAWAYLTSAEYDIAVLDIMMPGMDGLTLVNRMRANGLTVPVLLLTARDAVSDRVQGLNAGADDYLVKPFAITELIARVESVLRRSGRVSGTIRLGDVVICQDSMTVSKGGQPVSLTLKEYELLLLFVQNPNTALFRQTIYQRVWDCDYMADTRTVDLHVQRLRKKLGWQEKLVSVYKVGYRLEVAL